MNLCYFFFVIKTHWPVSLFYNLIEEGYTIIVSSMFKFWKNKNKLLQIVWQSEISSWLRCRKVKFRI